MTDFVSEQAKRACSTGRSHCCEQNLALGESCLQRSHQWRGCLHFADGNSVDPDAPARQNREADAESLADSVPIAAVCDAAHDPIERVNGQEHIRQDCVEYSHYKVGKVRFTRCGPESNVAACITIAAIVSKPADYRSSFSISLLDECPSRKESTLTSPPFASTLFAPAISSAL